MNLEREKSHLEPRPNATFVEWNQGKRQNSLTLAFCTRFVPQSELQKIAENYGFKCITQVTKNLRLGFTRLMTESDLLCTYFQGQF